LYVDGILDSEVTSADQVTVGALAKLLRIGDVELVGASSYGYTDNAHIYNRALSSAEIASLYINPYQMFEHDPIELWAAAAASAVTDTGIVILRRRRECA